ncbi:hypothetical protein LguiA_030081 [Lonicera macranthoides]
MANNRSLAYFAEGIGESYDWKELIKNEQRSNGSIFNSPATTAAALIHLHDDKCIKYLQSVLKINGKAVPTIYPYDKYARLSMVDTLERMGIARYFKCEINNVLDETHRYWQLRNEEIFLDPACCALAFRLLWMHGYEVSSLIVSVTNRLMNSTLPMVIIDIRVTEEFATVKNRDKSFVYSLEEYVDQEHFFNTSSPQITTANTIIELYKASEVKILEDEPILENIQNWTNTFLKHQLSNQEICDDQLRKEVDYALDYSINSLSRLAHRSRIELYNVDHFQMLKTSYRCSNIVNTDIHELSIQDYNKCQAILQEELDQLVKWAENSSMVGLNFNWHFLITCYFQIAAVHFLPEEADVRALWTHAGVIGTLLDDMFDDDSSREELLNIVELVEKWDDHSAVGYASKRVEILFSEAQKSVDYFASRGFIVQGRCIRHELVELWVKYIKSQMKEVEWWMKKETPSMDEYIINGCGTIGVGLWVIGLYFLGVEFSKETMSTPEFQSLYKHGGLLPRLLNDCHGIKERDKVQRKINGCWLLMKHENGAITEEEAVKEVTRMSENSNREVLRTSLLQTEKSVIPRVIGDAFFKLLQIGHYLYDNSVDEYRCPIKNFDDIKAVLYEPISISTNMPMEMN